MKKVSKVFIKIEGGEETYFLFSRKYKESNQESHGRLELLGGEIEAGESPQEGLIRELKEEDTSHTLRGKILRDDPQEIRISDEPHYIYEIAITWNDFSKLRHKQDESFGFELVPIGILSQDAFERDVTPKTKKILREYNPAR